VVATRRCKTGRYFVIAEGEKPDPAVLTLFWLTLRSSSNKIFRRSKNLDRSSQSNPLKTRALN
jgi:hypothetical protein